MKRVTSPGSDTATATTATTGESSSSRTKKRKKSDSEKFYHVKWIVYEAAASPSKRVPIVLQNENGPCPLIAISNVLLLKGQLTLPEGTEIVSLETLLESVGEYI